MFDRPFTIHSLARSNPPIPFTERKLPRPTKWEKSLFHRFAKHRLAAKFRLFDAGLSKLGRPVSFPISSRYNVLSKNARE